MTNALQGFATGNRAGKAKDRPQSIYTPQVIWDVCYEVWPEGVLLDPCAGEPGKSLGRPKHSNPGPEFGGFDALAHVWPERCYINPPYSDLKKWLTQSSDRLEQIWLVPNRTRSQWFRDWRDSCSMYAELNRLSFVGFEGSFPESLVLGYFGYRLGDFRRAVESRGLGTIYRP